EMPAHGVDLLGDGPGRARLGALEEHVLDEVRHPALRVRFVAGSARQPDAEAHGPHVRHRLGDEPDAVGQGVVDDHGWWVGPCGRRARGPETNMIPAPGTDDPGRIRPALPYTVFMGSSAPAAVGTDIAELELDELDRKST